MSQYVYTMRRVGKVVPPKRAILKNISLNFFPGAKIGVLGLNGAGKSSLLKIMAGVDKDFEGEAIPQPNLRVGFLPQEPQLDPAKDVRGNVEEGLGAVLAEKKRLEEIYAAYSETDADFEKLAEEQSRLESLLNQTNVEHKLEIAADALRLPSWDMDVTKISGGERRRVALCRLLLSEPDMLLLDEPTNHLDALSVQWLEQYLERFPGTVMAVTHDLLPRQRRRLDPRARPRLRHPVAGQLLRLARAEGAAPGGRGEAGGGAHQGDAGGARVGARQSKGKAREEQGAPRALQGARVRRRAEAQRDQRNLHPARAAPRRPGDRSRGAEEGVRRQAAVRESVFPPAARRHRRHHRAERRRENDALQDPDQGHQAGFREAEGGRDGEAVVCRSIERCARCEENRVGRDLRRPGPHPGRRLFDAFARLRRALQLPRRRPAEAGGRALGRRAQPRAPRQAGEERRQPAAAR